MKHQYFGDIIDLFKYDLLTTFYKELKLDGITFIPMLTENDGTTEGSKRNYEKAMAGTKNSELINFLKLYDEIDKRNVNEIQKYFDGTGIPFKLFSNKIFLHKQRKEYFSEILQSTYHNQILFFDPDNGLEVKHNNHKHILFSDIRSCLEIINDNSIISIIQFRHRASWSATLENKLSDLIKHISPNVTFVANNNIAFFILAKSKKRLDDIQTCLTTYQTLYPNLITK